MSPRGHAENAWLSMLVSAGQEQEKQDKKMSAKK